MHSTTGRWIVGITGASGMKYAIRLLQALCTHADVSKIDLIVSEAALRVLNEEENIRVSSSSLSAEVLTGSPCDRMEIHSVRDIGASCASGSSLFDGMVIVPCSMSTLGAIAGGVPQNLIHRAADVTIKENRRLILVPRETPLSAIHLENMLKLSRIGVRMAAAMPGFYHQPQSLEDIVDMMVMKVLDCMGLSNDLAARWRAENDKPSAPVRVIRT